MDYKEVKDDIIDALTELSVHDAVVALKTLNDNKYKGVTSNEVKPHLLKRLSEVLIKKAEAVKLEEKPEEV